ncbi:MAG: hypothetical protein AAFX57_19560 [Bacteroidota bacterium]
MDKWDDFENKSSNFKDKLTAKIQDLSESQAKSLVEYMDDIGF